MLIWLLVIQRWMQPSERHAHAAAHAAAAAAAGGGSLLGFPDSTFRLMCCCVHTTADLAAEDASLLECSEEFAWRKNRRNQTDALTFPKTRKGCVEVAQSAPPLSPGKRSFHGLPLLTELGKASFQNEPLRRSKV